MGTGQSDLPQVSLLILNKREAAAAATKCSLNVWFSPSCLPANFHYQIVTLQNRACLSFTLASVQPAHLYAAASGEHLSGFCLECYSCSHTPIAAHAKAHGHAETRSRHHREAAACVVFGT